MKKFLKKLDIILGVLILTCAIAGAAYIGFINPTALKPSFSISLNGNGSTLDNNEFFAKKGTTIELPTPTKEGYIFDGWYNGDTKWSSEDIITGNLELTAKWIPIKHTITFVVDGIEYEQLCDYDSTPEFNGTPTKAPTVDKDYTFLAWQPAITTVKGNAIYTATFTEQIRQFDINITTNQTNPGTITGGGSFDYGSSATISVSVNPGYNFIGWYKNGSFYSTDTEITIDNITTDIDLEAQFSIIVRTITYNNTFSTPVNPTSYTITLGEYQLLPQNRNGYEFIGWFTESNGNGDKIETIDSSLLIDYVLYAHYEIKTFLIEYSLDGGTVTYPNPTSYKITDASFTLNNPTKENYTFLGWTGTGLSSITQTAIIPNGSYGNRSYTAHWQPMFVEISFCVDGINLISNTLTINRGEAISAPSINSSQYGMSGYSVNGWYTEPECINLFNFNSEIKNNTTLYSKWTYLLDTGFYPYISRFDNAVVSHTLTLGPSDSEDTLIKWIEYIAFHNITESTTITLNFTNGFIISDPNEATFKTKVNSLINKSTFPSENVIGYSYSKSNGVYKLSYLYCASSKQDGIANGSLDTPNPSTLTQLDYGLIKQNVGRDSDFDDFNIKQVKQTISVSTSNQLVYALQNGLQPICVAGSPAEDVYNKAKSVLNEIVNNSMTDLEKVRAIYDWLLQNVSYDHTAANNPTISNNWVNYNAWYAEGVFNNKLAVCDGYAKAFIILAKLENIPIIRVTGNQHAWNKVYINGTWYGIDATHGDLTVGSNEIHTYSSFLFTDAQKAASGYSTTDFPSVSATTTFNYYDYETYTTDSGEVDLLITSLDYSDLNLLLTIVESYISTTTYFSIEIAIDPTLHASISGFSGNKVYDLFYNPYSSHSLSLSSYVNQGTDAYGNYVYTLLIN